MFFRASPEYNLSSWFVCAEVVEDHREQSDKKMKRFTATLGKQFAELDRLEKVIRENFTGLGC